MGLSGAEDTIQSLVCLIQAVMLGSFALLLTAHQSDLMDRNSKLHSKHVEDEEENRPELSQDYNPPHVK